ncbi:MAG: FAD-binding oxidoreductase [Actinobacteria bacterium]|nr:FAD-binding oxidoreductase [Actinomycetota bacterium]MBU1944987.1 FAD-binding oxidoreductase [Actinomycetota bacterium]MBU2688468.1 FAD-binding oxidoreductase [Actinomycetota bacterium]
MTTEVVETVDLPEAVYEELKGIVGQDNISREPAVLDTYAFQYIAELLTGHSYLGRPCAVVMPASTEEVQAIVRLCNRESIPYKAVSTGWGAYGGSPAPGILQLDLRRMNRILDIDTDNMIAVVEPYVVGATLQAEAFKLGLNCHIVGAGSNTSILASATSVMGQGTTGVSTGFSNRNLLGFEWVMPDGELLRVGCFEDSDEWFTGDGPGPSLRGIIRGFAGAFGGLGVFTKCAVKLYPWFGPSRIELTGVTPEYDVEMPKNHIAYLIAFPGWEEMKEFGNRVGEAEIAFSMCHNAPAPMIAAMMESNMAFYDLWKGGLAEHFKYSLEVVIAAQSEDELAFQEGVLRDIIRRTKGREIISSKNDLRYYVDLTLGLGRIVRQAGPMATLRTIPPLAQFMIKSLMAGKRPSMFAKTLYISLVKQHLNARGIFRFGGSFWTSMGALTSWDCCIENAKEGEQIKRKWIDEGVLMDDGAENAWGGLYESGCYGHLEELGVYDQSDPICVDHGIDFVVDTVEATINKHLAMSLNATGDPFHAWYSPHVMNYHDHVASIKEEFDRANLSDASVYINRSIVESLMKMIEDGGGNFNFREIMDLANDEFVQTGPGTETEELAG